MTERDKIYIETENKKEQIEVPKYGEIRIVIVDGKITKRDITDSKKFT